MILLPVWKRIAITKACLRGIKRLQRDERFNIEVVLVYSDLRDKENLSCFFDETFHLVAHKNNPLGQKLNKGIERALELGFDYLMQLGSDDILSIHYLDAIYPYIDNEVKYFGPDRLYFYHLLTGKLKFYFAYGPHFGAGRMIHRSLLEGRREWFDPEINQGLDNSLNRNIYQHHEMNNITMSQSIGYQSVLVLDVKGENNIHAYDDVPGVEYSDEVKKKGRLADFPELKGLMV